MSRGPKTFFIFLLTLAAWFGVAIITDGYGDMDEQAGPIVLFLVPIIISSIYYFNAKKSKKEVNAEKSKKEVKKEPKTLTEKYGVLEYYKGLAYLLMFVNTGFTIYSLVQISDASKAMKKYGGGASMDNAMLAAIATYVITMFSLFCLTKIIDFLFDLDKQDKILAPDKISSEEE